MKSYISPKMTEREFINMINWFEAYNVLQELPKGCMTSVIPHVSFTRNQYAAYHNRQGEHYILDIQSKKRFKPDAKIDGMNAKRCYPLFSLYPKIPAGYLAVGYN